MLQQAVSREAYAAGVPSWVNKAGSQVELWNADTLSTKESALQHRAILEGKKCHCEASPKSGPRNPVPEIQSPNRFLKYSSGYPNANQRL